MKVEEAVSLIDQVIAQIQANRETHFKLQEAIQVIKETLMAKS